MQPFTRWIFSCVLALVLARSQTASAADVPTLWVSRFASLKGDDSCAHGSADCNRCVYDVERQFRDLTQRSAHTRRIKIWDWDRFTDYEPHDLRPTDVLRPIPLGHFQGMARVANQASGAPDLFISHSGKTGQSESGIFAVRSGEDYRARVTDGPLKYLYEGTSTHPGGMQAVGSYLLIANEEENTASSWTDSTDLAWIDVLDTRDLPSDQGESTFLPDIFTGANVAGAKLASGGYLLIVNETSYHNRYRFYYSPSLRPLRLEPISGQVKTDWDTGFHGDGGYENISLVTECGTDRLFMIGATAADNKAYGPHDGVWSLFEVSMQGEPSFRHIANNTRDMYSQECDPRAAGSAFAGKFGELGLYCHQKLHDENTRRSGIMCVLGLLPIYSCIDAASSSRNIAYTEFWPTTPTPEYADFVERTLTVMLNAFESGPGTFGIVEATTGQICETREGVDKSCSFEAPKGTTLDLRPFVSAEASSMQTFWGGGCYNNQGSVSNDLTKYARSCSFTLNDDMSITLGSTSELASGGGGGSSNGGGFIDRPVRETP